jgi:ketosteroid isomerase-like protein
MELAQERAALFQIRAGRVTRYVVWWDRAHALADLGLE